MATRIQLRRDTRANWVAANPVLAQGEAAIITGETPQVLVVGDGSTAFNSLPEATLDPSAAFVQVEDGPALIARQVLTATAASVTFANIPQTYHHLELLILAGNSANSVIDLQFNNDTGANYHDQRLNAADTAVTGVRAVGQTSLSVASFFSGDGIGQPVIVDIPGYSRTTQRKAVLGRYLFENEVGGLNGGPWFGTWRNAAGISEIDIIRSAGVFAIGSVFSLIGKP